MDYQGREKKLQTKISRAAQSLNSSGIRRIFDLSSQLKNPINLSIGQPDFPIYHQLRENANQLINEGFNNYTPTQGDPLFIDYLKKELSQRYATDIPDLMVTSGVTGGLYLSFLTLLDPYDEIIVPDPYFVMYKQLPACLGAKPVYLDTYPNNDFSDFHIDSRKIGPLITTKTKAIVINTPANPTGKVLSSKEIENIITIAEKHDLYIISDEIYDYFYYPKHFKNTVANYRIPSPFGRYKKTILLGGFSKTFSITGWRVGYAIAPEEILQEMKKLQQYIFVCSPAPFQRALIGCFEEKSMQYIKKQIKLYSGKADYLYQQLKPYYKIKKSEGAFYSFIEAPGVDGLTFVEKAIENNLLIVPGNIFSEKNSHFRISFAADDKTLSAGVEVLKKLYNKQNKKCKIW